MRKRKRQAVKKLIQCAAVIAAGVLAIILFMLAIWYRGKNSIAGLSQLKPILQTQAMKGNGRNTKQGLIDAAELGKHFDTAIDAMTMLLAGFKEESEAQNEE